MTRVSDSHIQSNTPLPAPAELARDIPRTERHSAFVAASRQSIARILSGQDPRFLLITGPCSIHDTGAGKEYAAKLAALIPRVSERLLLVMRVYFEKPRTTVGWKGLIMDPHLDGSCDIGEGLRAARNFMREVIDLNVPTATEMLDPITPQYIADLTCWTAIGARTTESQTHRQMASGLSMPVGFKNTTSGDIRPAINAIKAARQTQTFLGISEEGRASVVTTTGNPDTHVILRGGELGPNHDLKSVKEAMSLLQKGGLRPVVMIDASHANCGKDCASMPGVYRQIVAHRASGERGVIGAMLESNLAAGTQPFPQPKDRLVYGQSITDSCIDWATTETLVWETFERLAPAS
ncbi:MAG: 3-deoxy-7-phosphoheptulonate synthase [Verrucomicrobia bacterium]|nr:3-deoxy-7-phosphoheptulonate synthase [Verrucomicrobiota bacterium]